MKSSRVCYNYDYELQCDTIYDLIVNHYMTLRQVESFIGLSRSTICRRINNYMRAFHIRRYWKVKDILNYNKVYRFRKEAFWDKVGDMYDGSKL